LGADGGIGGSVGGCQESSLGGLVRVAESPTAACSPAVRFACPYGRAREDLE
ncbi:Hypothetical predicted protein, partial [Pelobates cultripes]